MLAVIREFEVENREDLEKLDLARGAKDTLEDLTDDEIETILQMVSEIAEDTLTDEGWLSDFLWHERETIAEWLGYSNFDEIMNRSDEEDL